MVVFRGGGVKIAPEPGVTVESRLDPASTVESYDTPGNSRPNTDGSHGYQRMQTRSKFNQNRPSMKSMQETSITDRVDSLKSRLDGKKKSLVTMLNARTGDPDRIAMLEVKIKEIERELEDARDAKEREDQRIANEFQRYGVSSKARAAPPTLVHTQGFNMVMGVVIIANAISMGLETDHGDRPLPPNDDGSYNTMGAYNITSESLMKVDFDNRMGWYILDCVFTTIFVLELALRFFYDGIGKKFWGDAWNCFDFMLVVLGIIDTFIIPFIPETPTSDEDISALGWEEQTDLSDPACATANCELECWLKAENGGEPNQNGVITYEANCVKPKLGGFSWRVFTALRLFRLFRLVKVLAKIPAFADLWRIVCGLKECLRSLVWVGVLLFVILYVGALVTTVGIGKWDQATEGDYVCELGSDMVERCRLDGVLVYPIYAGRWTKEDYFGSMMESWFTLLQVVTLDHWSTNIVRPLLKERWVWCLFFLALLMLVTFALLNMVIGVVTENAVKMAKNNEKENQNRARHEEMRVMEHLRAIFEATDQDGNGMIDTDEFNRTLQRKVVKNRLALLDIPMSDLQEMFHLLDSDESGEVTMEEFFRGFLKLKGPAKGKDMITLSVSVQRCTEHLDYIHEGVDEQDVRMQTVIDRLDDIWIEYFCPRHERGKARQQLEALRRQREERNDGEAARIEAEAKRKKERKEREAGKKAWERQQNAHRKSGSNMSFDDQKKLDSLNH